jgi:hypothetical protein
MGFSLVNVSKEYNGLVDGVWMQHCTAATLEEATQRARDTEKANSDRITVAVVDDWRFGIQDYNHKTGMERLDGKSEVLYNTGLTLHELRQIRSLMDWRLCGEITEQEARQIERWAADNPESVNDITDRYKVNAS